MRVELSFIEKKIVQRIKQKYSLVFPATFFPAVNEIIDYFERKKQLDAKEYEFAKNYFSSKYPFAKVFIFHSENVAEIK